MMSLAMKSRFVVCAFFLFGTVSTAGAQDAQEKVKFLTTGDGAITAYFVGPKCAERVEMLFEATASDAFDESTTAASRLMANAVSVLSRQCSRLDRVVSKGQVGDRILYSGIAEAATDWKLRELGVRSASGVLSAEEESGSQGQFGQNASFSAYPDLSDDLQQGELCANPDDQGTCSGTFTFSDVTPATARTNARYLLDETGTEARLEYVGQDDEGFLCSQTNDVGLDVVGGDLTPDGRKDYASMLRERVQSAGDRLCIGFQTAGDGLLMGTFDSQGRSMGEPVPMRTVDASSAELRLDQ